MCSGSQTVTSSPRTLPKCMLTITSPQLPALSYLDIDKVKREEEAYQHRNVSAAHSLPPVTAASPTYAYPSGPPPPYSQPPPAPAPAQHPTSWAPVSAHTPPESRRPSEEDGRQRQSLPSLSEALGVDSQTTYQTHRPAAAPGSPISAAPKRYGMEPPRAPQSHLPSGTYFTAQRKDPLPAVVHAQPSQPAIAPVVQQASYPTPATTASPSTASTSGFAYGYTPYPPRYAQPSQPSSQASGPIYQPSANYPPPSTAATSWRSDTSAKFASSEPSTGPGDYSASVKRHLDLYDLEGALNEISQSSSILTDFSRRYGDRLHQTARSGTPHDSLPGIVSTLR